MSRTYEFNTKLNKLCSVLQLDRIESVTQGADGADGAESSERMDIEPTASLPEFIDREAVLELTDAQKEVFTQQVADRSHRIAQTLHSVLTGLGLSSKGILVKDLEVNRQLTVGEAYEDLGLWRTVLRQNVILHKKMKKYTNKATGQSRKATATAETAMGKAAASVATLGGRAGPKAETTRNPNIADIDDTTLADSTQINPGENSEAQRLANLIARLGAGENLFAASESATPAKSSSKKSSKSKNKAR